MRNFPSKYSHVTTFYRNFVAEIKAGRNFCKLHLTDCTLHEDD